jgi:hypothetical protein
MLGFSLYVYILMAFVGSICREKGKLPWRCLGRKTSKRLKPLIQLYDDY